MMCRTHLAPKQNRYILTKSGGDRGNLKAMGQGQCEFQIGHAETKVLSHTKVKNVQLYGIVTQMDLKPKENDGHEP